MNSKYKKLPVVIDAWQVISGTSIPPFVVEALQDGTLDLDFQVVQTGGGEVHFEEGDWIIKGVAGEFYPCKEEIFKKTYEVDDAN